MLVEFNNSAEARRAQLDGYERTGDKSIEADVSDLDSLLDRDDVSVNKVVLHRNNGDAEATVIDREIQNHYGDVEYKYVIAKTYKDGGLDARSKTLFDVGENKIKINDQFSDVVSGDYTLLQDPDDFQEQVDRVIENKQETIQSYREKIEELEDDIDELNSMTPEEFL